MMGSRSFRDLIVWQKSIDLAKDIYKKTELFPEIEKFGLVNQMRRAGVSIASNISEGSKRGSKKDFCQFLRIALGSAAELETQVIISKEIYPKVDFRYTSQLIDEIERMLSVLIHRLSTEN